MDFLEIVGRVLDLNPKDVQNLESKLAEQIPPEMLKQLQELIKAAYEDSPKIAIIGAPGVGKTSTINALFNPYPLLPVGPSVPMTNEPHMMRVPLGGERGEIIVIDFPGLGESIKTDEEMIPKYKKLLAECDVAVYVIKADDRTLADDQLILRRILTKDLKKRLVIGLNQIDLLGPGQWSEEYNVPSLEQDKSIETKVRDLKKKLKEIDLEPRFLVPYSATHAFRLVQLFYCMMRVCPAPRAWVLGSRKKISSWQNKQEPEPQKKDLDDVRRLGQSSYKTFLTGAASKIGMGVDKVLDFFGPVTAQKRG